MILDICNYAALVVSCAIITAILPYPAPALAVPSLVRAYCLSVHPVSELLFFRFRFSFLAENKSQTFACDDLEEVDRSYLRADYRISCNSRRHKAYEIYAGFMILVSYIRVCVETGSGVDDTGFVLSVFRVSVANLLWLFLVDHN